MHIGEAGVEEPMAVYLSFMRRVDRLQQSIQLAFVRSLA
jgi:hypothetical protein